MAHIELVSDKGIKIVKTCFTSIASFLQYIFSLKKFVNVNPIDVDRNLSKIETKDFPPGSSLILDQVRLLSMESYFIFWFY